MDTRLNARSGFSPRPPLDAIAQDLRFALRSFRLNRLFTATAIVTLALGIAAATTVASIVDATLLRPLPFPDADRVVYISRVDETGRLGPSARGRTQRGVTLRAALGLPRSVSETLRANPAFESVTEFAPWVSQPYTLAWAEGARVVNGVNVSHDFFSVFRVRPARGRSFTAEDSNVSKPAVCVVTSTGARRFFNGRRDIVGETLSLVEGQLTVVGVMGDEFWYPMGPEIVLGQGEAAPDLLVPWPWLSDLERPGRGRGYGVAARLRAGTTIGQADREARAAALTHGEPRHDGSREAARARWLHDEFALDARPTLLALAGLVACLLLVCSVTIANFLHSRSRTRSRELAVRSVLGAGRGRLLAQLVTENLLLAACGGLCALFLTIATLDTFVSLLPQGIMAVRTVPVDGRTFAIAALMTVGVALLSGLGPALAATRGDLSSALKTGGQAVKRTPRWRAFGSLLVALESAALLVLLAGGGLLINTLVRLQTIDLGFTPSHVWTADLAVPRTLYPQRPQVGSLVARMSEALGRIPGVVSVGEADWGLLGYSVVGMPVAIEGQPDAIRAEVRHVSAGYFQAVSMAVKAGRLWTREDENVAPRVAVVNATAARRYWGDEDPIGRRLLLSPRGDKRPVQIVGVVSDLRETNERRTPEASIYLPINPLTCIFYHNRTFVVRTERKEVGLGREALKAMAGVDPRLPITMWRADEWLANRRDGPRFYAVFVGMAAVFGLLLAAVGIAGIAAQSVTRRTREIGVRVALGAKPSTLVRMVVRQACIPVVIGTAVGLAGALALSRVMTAFLYEVAPQDPGTHAVAVGLLVGIALLAAWFPARRAARINPVEALRAE